ncbi:HK97 gp10 family phage protein [Ewingella americana]
MGMKVKGMREAKQNMSKFIDDVKGKKVVRAMTKALIIGSTQAALYTPIDTSTLINSQFRDMEFKGTRLVGRVGYSANYAVYVHDPTIKQTFRRATAEKEFLVKGFEDTKGQIEAAIISEMKV